MPDNDDRQTEAISPYADVVTLGPCQVVGCEGLVTGLRDEPLTCTECGEPPE